VRPTWHIPDRGGKENHSLTDLEPLRRHGASNAYQKLHFTMVHVHNDTVVYRNNASVFCLPFLLLSARRGAFVVHSTVGVLALIAFTVR
jgi:hypothetical protein